MLKIEGIKIGESNSAPLITKIVGPSIETKQIGKIKKEDSERHRLRLKFWTILLEIAKSKHNLFNGISPSKDTWISTSAELKGVSYSYWVTKNEVSKTARQFLAKPLLQIPSFTLNMNMISNHQTINSR
ncbi:MAG: DUF4268 domain-containing protein [Bacteroidota bacterium]|nr:DUF4268 domain-containing protein [Bacteroidota bacterium]